MPFYNAHEEYRFYQRKQIRLCLNQKARRRIIMTNIRINASLNTAKEIINALMNSEEIFYDRTKGNELSGRFSVQMTFAESICYRPQYSATLSLIDMDHSQFAPELHLQQYYLSVNSTHMRTHLFRCCLPGIKNLSQSTNSSKRTGVSSILKYPSYRILIITKIY